MNRKLLIALIAVGSAVLIALVVVTVQLVRLQQQLDYERCLAVFGFTPEQPVDDLDAMLEAVDYCLSK